MHVVCPRFGNAEVEFARATANVAPAVRAAVQRSVVGSAGPGNQVHEMRISCMRARKRKIFAHRFVVSKEVKLVTGGGAMTGALALSPKSAPEFLAAVAKGAESRTTKGRRMRAPLPERAIAVS